MLLAIEAVLADRLIGETQILKSQNVGSFILQLACGSQQCIEVVRSKPVNFTDVSAKMQWELLKPTNTETMFPPPGVTPQSLRYDGIPDWRPFELTARCVGGRIRWWPEELATG